MKACLGLVQSFPQYTHVSRADHNLSQSHNVHADDQAFVFISASDYYQAQLLVRGMC